MTRLLSRRRRDDEGAFAVLYAVAMVVLLVVAALVVDISTMRADRRTERAAADSGAVAGAYFLAATTTSSPRQACTSAVQMAYANLLGEGTVVTPDCGSIPATVNACPGSSTVVSTAYDAYTVTVTWPVPDSDPMMTHPDNAPSNATQSTFASTNGTLDGSACGRIGVSVSKSADYIFASVLNLVGTGSQSNDGGTTSASVALGKLDTQQTEVAALNILDRHACDALQTSGQGSIKILAVTDTNGVTHPGAIAVESDGHPSGAGSSCPNSAPYVIDPQNNPNNFIDAQGAGGAHTGVIQGWALQPSPTGNPPYQSDTSLPLSVLGPKVTLMLNTFSVMPVTDKYGCQAVNPASSRICGSTLCPSCAPYSSGAPIPSLLATLNSDTPAAYSGAQEPYATSSFQTLSNSNTSRTDALKTFSCSPSANFYLPPGNWYIDCPGTTGNSGFQVGSNRSIVFGGGTIVFHGKVDVSGCLAVNVPSNGTTAATGNTVACPPVNTSTLTSTPDTTRDALVLVRTGRFYEVSNGSRIVMPRTAVVMADNSASPTDAGALQLNGSSTPILWTAPTALDCGNSTTCQYGRLQKVMYWSESPNTQVIGGQANMLFRGVFFTPAATFEYKGQGTLNAPLSAQVWSGKLLSDGQGTLVMAPDPKDTIGRPLTATVLIR